MNPDEIKFEADLTAERATDEPALVVDVEGFEGPLDLLLALARQQKVDLARISILALADQYLTFIEAARKLRLELAADYLVMAAWLAYLKSRLLLPDANAPQGRARRIWRIALALRLKRLEAIRAAAERLFGRAQLDRDVFQRGQPEPIAHIKRPEWTATLYDLLSAYAQQRQKTVLGHVRLVKRTVWSLAEAREALERLIGQSSDWARLDEYLISFVVEPSLAPTVFASSFASTLELVREGVMEVHQQAAFSPLYVRKASTGWKWNSRSERRGGAGRRQGIEEAVAMPRLQVVMPDDEPDDVVQSAARKSFDCLRPCCLLRPSRSMRSRWRRGCRRASTSMRRSCGCRRSTPRGASIWCVSAASGPSAPRTICPGC